MSALCDFTIQRLLDEKRIVLEDVVLMQNWIQENCNDVPQLTEEQIAVFLAAYSNDIGKTKRAISTNYRLRREHSEIFNNRDMQCKELQKAASVIEISAFPNETPDGYRIFFGKITDPVYSNLDMEPCLKLVGMSIDVDVSEYPPKGMGFMHLTRIKLGLLKPLFQYIQRGLNFKLIRVHIINTVYFLDKVMALLSPFLSAELIELLHFHPPDIDMDEFYTTCIPKHCLPEDYGGDLPSVRSFHEARMKRLAELQYYF